MRIRFLEIAQIELDDAIEYYNYEVPGLGEAFLKKARSFTSEEIASAIGTPEEVEMIFKLLEHAVANVDHPIKKIPATPPFHSRYQYSTGVM